MNENDSLINEFYDDTHSHIENVEECLLKLESSSDDKEMIDSIFRSVHSIKGNAGMLGLEGIREVGEVFENFLEDIRTKGSATGDEMDKMFNFLDNLKLVVTKTKGGEVETSEATEPPDAEALGEDETVTAGMPPLPEAMERDRVSSLTGMADELVVQNSVKKDLDKVLTLLTFILAGELYGVDIMQVREIILAEEITPVPNTSPFLVGVMNLRDQIIPVFNLKEKLNILDYDKSLVEKNVIVMEIDKSVTGVKVDDVTSIISLKESKITTADNFEGSVHTDYLRGIGQSEEETVIILNTMELCNPEEMLY